MSTSDIRARLRQKIDWEVAATKDILKRMLALLAYCACIVAVVYVVFAIWRTVDERGWIEHTATMYVWMKPDWMQGEYQS